jgi:hypothetical protein
MRTPSNLTSDDGPALDKLPPLTRALIKMLRASEVRPTPLAELSSLIDKTTPLDLHAYIHAWATHQPNAPVVDEFWLEQPKRITSGPLHRLARDSIQIGTLASGEPILARPSKGSSRCEVTMIDEEGVPTRYRGLEGFLLILKERAKGELELDAWLD